MCICGITPSAHWTRKSQRSITTPKNNSKTLIPVMMRSAEGRQPTLRRCVRLKLWRGSTDLIPDLTQERLKENTFNWDQARKLSKIKLMQQQLLKSWVNFTKPQLSQGGRLCVQDRKILLNRPLWIRPAGIRLINAFQKLSIKLFVQKSWKWMRIAASAL